MLVFRPARAGLGVSIGARRPTLRSGRSISTRRGNGRQRPLESQDPALGLRSSPLWGQSVAFPMPARNRPSPLTTLIRYWTDEQWKQIDRVYLR